MKVIKEILTCVVPFIVAALVWYPFMAIAGANFNPFEWGRDDRVFYFILSVGFGIMLLVRVMHIEERV